MRISNVQFSPKQFFRNATGQAIFKTSVFIFAIFLVLATGTLSCQAFSFDDFWGNFEEILPWEESAGDSAEIINEVNVSANTGDNTSEEGEITEGEGKIKIEIRNVIDGTEIEPIEIESSEKAAEVQSKIEANDDTAVVHQETEINGEKSEKNYEVDLSDNSTEQTEQTETKIEWWEDFKETIKSFFENIFDIFSLATAFAEETVIETGDATAESETENTVNTNITETDGDIAVTDDNEASVENGTEISSETGTNTASSSENVVINSGNAVAEANVINVVNTNILDSSVLFLLLNKFFGFNENLDLRENELLNTSNNINSSSDCNCDPCDPSGTCHPCCQNIFIKNNNRTDIINDIIVRSSTGNNQVNNNGEEAVIETGDAYAGANVVNIANANIVDSNYLLLAFNNFGQWTGDMVFPGKEFFSNFFSKNHYSPSRNTKVKNNNQANIENKIDVNADTGGNESINNEGTAIIQTGDASSSTNVINQVNTNIFNDNSFLMLLQVHGNWSGNIFSLPPGILWKEDNGIIQLFSALEEEENSMNAVTTPRLNVSNNNEANIINNIQVLALTGENKITGNEGEKIINTGNAYSAANVLNVANTNVIGANWLLAIINVFGDWDGDIAFGRPDLWLGGRAETAHNPVGPGETITYHFTIVNRGDADATNVKLKDLFDKDLLAFNGSDYNASVNGSEVLWDIGTIPAGDSAEISFDAVINLNVPFGETFITNQASVSSLETDEDLVDNTDTLTVTAYKEYREIWTGTRITLTPDPILKIVKTNNAPLGITASSTVDFKIVITNDGGQAYNSVLTDTIKNEQGDMIHTEEWNLDEIFPNEEITITYTVVLNASTSPGIYTNYAQIKAIGRHPSLNPFYGWFADSEVASSSFKVIKVIEEDLEEENFFSAIDSDLANIKDQILKIKEEIEDFLLW
ncbi:MAG: hypothetical protein AB1643_02290 [Patescibacteria group bacterium]